MLREDYGLVYSVYVKEFFLAKFAVRLWMHNNAGLPYKFLNTKRASQSSSFFRNYSSFLARWFFVVSYLLTRNTGSNDAQHCRPRTRHREMCEVGCRSREGHLRRKRRVSRPMGFKTQCRLGWPTVIGERMCESRLLAAGQWWAAVGFGDDWRSVSEPSGSRGGYIARLLRQLGWACHDGLLDRMQLGSRNWAIWTAYSSQVRAHIWAQAAVSTFKTCTNFMENASQ